MYRVSILGFALVITGAAAAGAQTPPGVAGAAADATWTLPRDEARAIEGLETPLALTPADREGSADGQPEPDWREGRACEGCPVRRPGRALLETAVINGGYEIANLVRGQVTARITPKSWWTNMKNGWVWDLDDFMVNQFGHPYQGNNYYNAGRANGLDFWESAALTAFGSATWEYFGETNLPSLNDFINTTLGGVALGEVLHRTAWLVRDTRRTGPGRFWQEIAAALIDPVTGANRFISDDVERVMTKPEQYVPSDLGGVFAGGVLWRRAGDRAVDETGRLFMETDLLYGVIGSGTSRTPYDAFAVRLRIGGGAPLSDLRVRGRLFGQPLGPNHLHLSVLQTYDFQNTDVYNTGAQSFEGALSGWMALNSRFRLTGMAWGGLTVLGAVDSMPPGEEPPVQRRAGTSGQGISEGPRNYDYGPGSNFGLTMSLLHGTRALAVVSYEGRHLYSLDGVRANHFLQRGRVDVMLPLRRALGVGVSGEYFDRQSFYQDIPHTRQRFYYPQLRAYFTWTVS